MMGDVEILVSCYITIFIAMIVAIASSKDSL